MEKLKFTVSRKRPLIWIISPLKGGRNALSQPLVHAFQSAGCDADDVFLSLYSGFIKVSSNYEDAVNAVISSLNYFLDKTKPDLIFDILPLPDIIINKAQNANVKSVFWFLENGLSEQYQYWRKHIDNYDFFYSFQGFPFNKKHEKYRYLPWGATYCRQKDCELSEQIIMHGSMSSRRESFFIRFYNEFNNFYNVKIKIIGPGWNKSEEIKKLNKGDITIEERWLGIKDAVSYYQGNIVLHPLIDEINAIPPRCFDILGAGGLLIAEYCETIETEFKDGEHFISFKSPEEAAKKTEKIIENRKLRFLISSNGRKEILHKNMLTHRIIKILKDTGLAED